MKLTNKTALITGGSKGIGKAIARAYLLHGASVVICGRSVEQLLEARRELSLLGDIDHFAANIADRRDVAGIKSYIEAKWTKLDVLVNNASVLGVRATILDYPEDAWEEVVSVNLNAQFFVTKSLLPMLLKSHGASIINVSSSVGRRGRGFWGAYAASKFALEGFTQALADELKSTPVRVNTVNPGATRTEMRAAAYPEEDPITLPAPDSVTPVFIYLASDESIGVTGAQLNARDYSLPQSS
ncbi:MAG: SDR family NAD(P)-dependent oxidoreductase [Deltaproteobacteria bacterium]